MLKDRSNELIKPLTEMAKQLAYYRTPAEWTSLVIRSSATCGMMLTTAYCVSLDGKVMPLQLPVEWCDEIKKVCARVNVLGKPITQLLFTLRVTGEYELDLF